MAYEATKRKELFRERITRDLEITELNKSIRGAVWPYETPNGIKHLWLHFDTNYDWWKACSRPQSDERFKNPVIHGFLGPKTKHWHVIPHIHLIGKFHLNHAENQIQVHRKKQPNLFDEYRDLSIIIRYTR